MRRTLFGRRSEVEHIAPAQVSVREALLFDVRDHESSADMTLIERRVGSWSLAPWLLLTGHIILATSLLLQDRPPASRDILAMVFVPMGLALLIDVVAGVLLQFRARLRMAPHTVARMMCGY